MPILILTRRKDLIVNRWDSCHTLLNGYKMVMMDPGDREVLEIPAGKHRIMTVIRKEASYEKKFEIGEGDVKHFHIYAMSYPYAILGGFGFIYFLFVLQDISNLQIGHAVLLIVGIVYFAVIFMSGSNLLNVKEVPVVSVEDLTITALPEEEL